MCYGSINRHLEYLIRNQRIIDSVSSQNEAIAICTRTMLLGTVLTNICKFLLIFLKLYFYVMFLSY